MKQLLKKRIKSGSEWNDWRWQMRNRITSASQLKKYLFLDEKSQEEIDRVAGTFPIAITPYYASLIEPGDKNCPIRRQVLPDPRELNVVDCDMIDPLHEDKDSPIQGLTHRYPDRVLLLATNFCAMNCRHCTRKRKVGDEHQAVTIEQVERGIEYIQNNPSIRDVLISGGDPFTLETHYLERIIGKVRAIPHVEIIRIGSRTPVVMPQRITSELVNMLKRYAPLWVNTHFNHPREITTDSRRALALLADAGIPLGNQSVLLRGVNDCPEIMKNLCHLLVKNRVRPYYLYQCDLSEGIEHFRTTISQGIEIMERLIGHTSGFAVPRYIVDAPGGGGKIPVFPNYVVSQCHSKVIMRNYEGVISVYNEPNYDHKAGEFCPRLCNLCSRDNVNQIGLEKLLDEESGQISLTPRGNKRAKNFI